MHAIVTVQYKVPKETDLMDLVELIKQRQRVQRKRKMAPWWIIGWETEVVTDAVPEDRFGVLASKKAAKTKRRKK